jgi:hypothetical protein
MPSSAQCKEFIKVIAYYIQKEAKARGYHVCSPIISQACCESNYGVSSLGRLYHNYHGMKCGSSWKGKSVNLKTKEEYTVGNLTTIRDNFRVYDSMEAGVKGYFDFINTKRYSNLKTAQTPLQFLQMIKSDGYCTSSTYVNTCMNIINKFDLTKYDNFLQVPESNSDNPFRLTNNLLREGSKGESVKWLQFELNKHGANLVCDGCFGRKTKLAVMLFQKDHGLKIDAIAGSKTLGKLKELQNKLK